MKKLSKIIKFILLIAPVAFLYSPDETIFGLFLRHDFLFIAAIDIAAFLYFVHVLLRENPFHVDSLFVRMRKWFFDIFRFRQPAGVINYLDIAVLFLVGAWGLATLTGVDRVQSFFGILQRMMGFVSIVHLALYYYLLRLNFRARDMVIVARVVSIAIVFMAGVGVLQALDILSYSGFQDRVPGSFTNTANFATVLMLGVFVSLFGMIREGISLDRDASFVRDDDNAGAWIGIYGTSILMALIGLALSQTRAALLGLGFGMGIFLLYVMLSRRARPIARRASAILIGTGVFLLALIIIQITLSPFTVRSELARRISDPQELMVGIRNRTFVWEAAWATFRDAPIAGLGPENFAYGYDTHFDPAIAQKLDSAEAWFDKAHNVILEALATMGVIGVIAYLFLFFVLLRYSWRLARDELEYAPLIGLGAAYLISGMFFFDTFESFAMLMAGVSIVAAEVSHRHLDEVERGDRFAVPRFVRGGGSLLGMALVFTSLVVVVAIPARASGVYFQAWKLTNAYDQNAPERFSKSFDFPNPYTIYMWQEYAELLLNNVGTIANSDPLLFTDLATVAFHEFEQFHISGRASARDYYMAARLGNFVVESLALDEQQNIPGYLDIGLSQSPQKLDLYYEKAAYYRNKGDYERAISYLEQARGIDPEVGFTYMNLGLAYTLARDFDRAIIAFEQAFDFGYEKWKENHRYTELLLNIYTIDRFYPNYRERVTEIYEALLHHEPENAQGFAELAAVYKDLGDYEMALDAAKRAIEANEAVRPAAELFIREVESLMQ